MVTFCMRQEELFTEFETVTPELPAVPGFRLELDFLTPEEERALLRHVDAGVWNADWRRRVQQYGLGYGSQSGKEPAWLRDFPDWLLPLAGRVGQGAGFDRFAENCVINEYVPPQGIAPHRDYRDFGEAVACVSLGSDVVMDLTNEERGLRVPVHVPARSFWVIRGEARWKWKHGIARRLTDPINGVRVARSRRVSITFRTGARANHEA